MNVSASRQRLLRDIIKVRQGLPGLKHPGMGRLEVQGQVSLQEKERPWKDKDGNGAQRKEK